MRSAAVPRQQNFYLTTFLIGLGFFTMGLMDPLYDSYVPLFLRDYISSRGIIGGIMTLDNIFALFMIPLVSALSDRTRTPIGRRMPWILVTLPLTAVFFSLVPFAAAVSLAALVVTLFCLNIFKQAARGPVVALMPDTIPGELRSEANGVINTMGGIAAIVGTIGLARLMDLSIVLPVIGDTHRKLPFLIAGVLVVIAMLLLFAFVRERQQATEEETKEPLFRSLSVVFREKEPSTRAILFSLLLWFFGYQGVLPFITMYSVDIIGTSEGTAGLSIGMFAVAYALLAIPAGIIAHRIGRRRTIRISLAAMTGVSLMLFLHLPLVSLLKIGGQGSLLIFWGLLFLFGAFWAAVATNSFPMLWQMATFGTMGIYTGLYYTFSQTAAVLSPPITGTIIDLLGFRMIFLFSAACMFAAFLVMAKVRRGEAGDDETLRAEEPAP